MFRTFERKLLPHRSRLIEDGPLRGDGREHPAKDPLISGFELTDAERADVPAFFDALSDPSFIRDRRFAAE